MAPTTSRRRAISYIGMGAVAATNLSSCCCLKNIFGNPCTGLEEWKKESKNWWTGRKLARDVQRKAEIEMGLRPDIQIPYPYLVCGRTDPPVHGHLGMQLRNFSLNQPGNIYIMVENQGNAPSWFCVVEIFESIFANYDIKFTDFTFNDRVVISAMPGQLSMAKLQFTPTRAVNGAIVIRSYDPFGDRMPPIFQQYDRHNTGGSWREFNF